MTMMKKNAVKSEFFELRTIYEYYLQFKPAVLTEKLEKGQPVYWWNIHPEEPNFCYSKILVSEETYEKLLKAKENPLSEKKKKGCCSTCYERLFGLQSFDEEMVGEVSHSVYALFIVTIVVLY